ncbi:DUF4383 domain-containing protein [Streptomyces sp. NPDC006692]|uniref:DUF4383 domain-containing protein n=1 Tax=unclassified Streptomyces TaxID=2593676 RepID=UPI0036AE534A
MKLRDELPTDHKLAQVYRWGAAFCGPALLIFGCLGFADRLSPFNTHGSHIAGLSTNGVVSLLSVVFGLVLIGGVIAGGNVASTVNMGVGALFLLSGYAHLFILDKPANFLGFGMTNVVFSFVMGLVVVTFGMYGRVTSRLPHDNPYWQRRHPRQAAREAAARRAAVRARASLPQGGISTGNAR